jgi:hypothetical protein
MPSQVVPTDIELRSRLPDETQPSENPPACSDSRRDGPKEKTPLFKLLSAGFSFFVAGTIDGSIGALIPYILSSYNVGTSFIGILYVYYCLSIALTFPGTSRHS